MTTKDLKRKLKARPGGSLKPVGSETCAKCGQPRAEYEVRLPEYHGKRFHALCCPEYTPYPGD